MSRRRKNKDPKLKTTSIYIHEDLLSDAKILVALKGISLSQLVSEKLEEVIKEKENIEAIELAKKMRK